MRTRHIVLILIVAALTNADQTQVYLLMVHCTTFCFSHNQKAIDDIMSSFTIGSPL